MVRTKADGIKAVGSKAPRKQFSSGAGGSGVGSSTYNDSPSRNISLPLVNHAKMWPAPKWQKGIGTFFSKKDKSEHEEGGCSTGSSGSSSPTTDERIESNDIIVKNTPCETNQSPNQSPSQNRIEEDITEIVLTEEPGSSSSSKRKVNGKAKVKGPVSNRKRRVVIADDSDSD